VRLTLAGPGLAQLTQERGWTVSVALPGSRALTAGIDPAGNTAVPILDDLVERYAETFPDPDTPKYRNALLRRLEIANDPRTERYLTLLHVINGWPTQPSLSPIFDWFICALRSHASSS
jgi:hypothetical protein